MHNGSELVSVLQYNTLLHGFVTSTTILSGCQCAHRPTETIGIAVCMAIQPVCVKRLYYVENDLH